MAKCNFKIFGQAATTDVDYHEFAESGGHRLPAPEPGNSSS
jgi:hypothetical protein